MIRHPVCREQKRLSDVPLIHVQELAAAERHSCKCCPCEQLCFFIRLPGLRHLLMIVGDKLRGLVCFVVTRYAAESQHVRPFQTLLLIAGEGDDPFGECCGDFVHETAVHHKQRLRRDGGFSSGRSRLVWIRAIKQSKKRMLAQASGHQVDRTMIVVKHFVEWSPL